MIEAPSNGKPLVSVVTPFFNTADYLEECIRSVLSQTYTHWEFILADNCSTDGSGDIADKFASSSPNIRIFHESEFLGQVENYNRALRRISPESKYCKIVQADDGILPNCLASMVAVAESSPRIGLISSLTLYEDTVGHIGLSERSSGPVYQGRDAARANLLHKKTHFGSPTCVMYLSSIVRASEHFFSTKSPHYEDAEVCFEILRDYDFAFVPEVLTFNRRNNDSIWSRIENYGPRLLHDLLFLYRFGRYFLSHAEMEEAIGQAEKRYYLFLVRRLWGLPDRRFWSFHIEGMRSAHRRLAFGRLARDAVRVLASMALRYSKRLLKALLNRTNLRSINIRKGKENMELEKRIQLSAQERR